MQYMILIYTAPFTQPRPGDEGFDEYVAPWLEFNRAHTATGALINGGSLRPVETATTIRREYGGGDTVIDGPFAETKELLGGYYLVEVADLDAALAIAASLPLPAGSFEVRPVASGILL